MDKMVDLGSFCPRKVRSAIDVVKTKLAKMYNFFSFIKEELDDIIENGASNKKKIVATRR